MSLILNYDHGILCASLQKITLKAQVGYNYVTVSGIWDPHTIRSMHVFSTSARSPDFVHVPEPIF